MTSKFATMPNFHLISKKGNQEFFCMLHIFLVLTVLAQILAEVLLHHHRRHHLYY